MLAPFRRTSKLIMDEGVLGMSLPYNHRDNFSILQEVNLPSANCSFNI